MGFTREEVKNKINRTWSDTQLHAAFRALLQDQDREQFVVAHPREVFKGAILANAASIALAHNHPSGDPTPSPEDRSLTQQLMNAGEILGIKIIDHLIIGDTHVSLRQITNFWNECPFHL